MMRYSLPSVTCTVPYGFLKLLNCAIPCSLHKNFNFLCDLDSPISTVIFVS